MAIATGIPPDVWADQGEEAIATALELLDKGRQPGGHDGPQMSG